MNNKFKGLNSFNTILNKLEAFTKKFYINELLKGSILFFAIGLLYFLFTLFIEYMLWLNPLGRTILFWLFIVVEALLFTKFIVFPLSKLLKLNKGINNLEASRIIGNHFPEVDDKLLNVLQLNNNNNQSELLFASIEQKSAQLSPVPFKLAINFTKNTKYLKYAAVPVLILLISFLSGQVNWFSDSYQRVVNYQTAYEPPAPFQFFVLNENLEAIEKENFKLLIKTAGEVIPDNAVITYNNETYYLQQKERGAFEYDFVAPKENITFNLSANGVISKPYILRVINVPTLVNFEMALNYPSYTKKKNETLISTGNAIVPQGTTITWKLQTKFTDYVFLYSQDTLSFRQTQDQNFEGTKRINKTLDYNLSTSNSHLKDYENLAFKIDVVNDENPELMVKMEKDSINEQEFYFYGQASDDYGLTKLQLVYYPDNNNNNKIKENIPLSSSVFSEFFSVFPGNLELQEGISYELYFEAIDNDALNNYKRTKSPVFSYRKLTKKEEENKQLQQQSESIEDLNKSLEKFNEQEKQLEELSKTQKEKTKLSFSDKKKLEEFIKRQKQQEEMMKNFNKNLQENLEEFQKDNEEQDQFKEDLKERLQENEDQLKENEKLLEELEKLQEKINKEEFTQKLEQLAKQNKNQKRSLEQMLELTKRFYVGKKLEKLQQQLEELAKKQEKLSNEEKEKNTKEKQDELNKEFENFQKEMEELQKENKDLKQPLDVPQDKQEEEQIEKEQNEASEQLSEKEESQDEKSKQENQQNAQKSQKSAARKMKKMSQKMQQAMQMSGGDQLSEDAETLRQILDNLILFSFDQEALMNQFRGTDINHNSYAKNLIKQSNLREYFGHIDDSLFALSLRQPKISERVNKEITDVYFNLDKALNQFSENVVYQGLSSQQFTVTAANNLADFLSSVLDNMQMQMSGSGSGNGQGNPSPGQGSGGGMQLPDIIMSQEELNKQMEEGLQKSGNSKEGNEGEGENPKEGEGQKGGEEGDSNQQGNGSGQKDGEGLSNEDLNGELYRIYQQQQQLRQALENRLKQQGIGNAGNNLIKQMEEIELELLNRGFTQRTLQKMMQLEHQLLKLENASFQQGEDNKRESKTNKQQYNNETNNTIPKAKQYFNATEILNRQTLPLQQAYKKKVQEYFKKKND